MAVHPSDGRLFISTFNPNQNSTPDPLPGGDGKVWALTNVQGEDPQAVTVTEVAAGLSEPLGMKFINGDLYVSHRTAITRLRDTNSDGYYETKENIGGGWISDNYHQFHFGLIESNGFAYTTLSTSIHFDYPGLNGPNPPNRGTLVRTNLTTGEVSYLAGGLPTDAMEAFEAHAGECDRCAAILERRSRLEQVLPREVTPDPHQRSRVLDRVATMQRAQRRRRWAIPMTIAASLVVVFGLTRPQVKSGQRPPVAGSPAAIAAERADGEFQRLDAAREELRAALAEQPGDAMLQRALQRRFQPGAVEGFQQVIDRVHLESFEGKLVIRRHEDNRRQRRRQLCHDAEPVQFRHLHIKKHHVGCEPADFLEGFAPAVGLADHLDVGLVTQKFPEPLARERFVIDD